MKISHKFLNLKILKTSKTILVTGVQFFQGYYEILFNSCNRLNLSAINDNLMCGNLRSVLIFRVLWKKENLAS